tara:strand:+ start:138 stop:776 length:639 start_codon:yes stop_codon:yes gene_type:complete
MPTIRRNNLSLGELGIATGQYGYSTDTMQDISASYANNRPQIELRWCNGNDTSGPIKFSEFYGEVSGAYDGKFGQELGDGDQAFTLAFSTANTTIQFQFENTGSKFHKIANRWQCYTKRRGAPVYWEINEETANFNTYFKFDPPSLGSEDMQPQLCNIDLVRPTSTTNYYGSLSASFCDCFNYQFGGAMNIMAPYSQSARYSVKKTAGGGGS